MPRPNNHFGPIRGVGDIREQRMSQSSICNERFNNQLTLINHCENRLEALELKMKVLMLINNIEKIGVLD